MLTSIFAWISLVLGVGLGFVVLYYWVLAVASIVSRVRAPRVEGTGSTRFVVVVPAHNEERLIGRTLASLAELDYARDLYRVVVIADNCDDRTAEIARLAGVDCLLREDKSARGKGHALRWAFSRLLPGDSSGAPGAFAADAFVVIDADTLVASNFLKVVGAYVQRGAEAVQAYHDVLHPERSPMASLTFLGYALSRNLKYPGRFALGSSANLLGNGMCFSRRLIAELGWSALGISEDSQFQLDLYLRGTRVEFAHGARVWSEIPGRLRAYHAQQKRWNVGRYSLRRRYIPALIGQAVRERTCGALHLVLDLLIPSYTILAGIVYSTWVVHLVARDVPLVNTTLWNVVGISFTCYIALGLALARAPFRVCLNLLLAPVFLASRVAIALGGWRGKDTEWVRSDRGEGGAVPLLSPPPVPPAQSGAESSPSAGANASKRG